MSFDFEAAVKDAILFGFSTGIIAAGLFLLWAFGDYPDRADGHRGSRHTEAWVRFPAPPPVAGS